MTRIGSTPCMSYRSVKRCAGFCAGGTVKQEDEEAGGKQTATTLGRVVFVFFHSGGDQEGWETAFRGWTDRQGKRWFPGVAGEELLRAAGNSRVFPRAPQHRGPLGGAQGGRNSRRPVSPLASESHEGQPPASAVDDRLCCFPLGSGGQMMALPQQASKSEIVRVRNLLNKLNRRVYREAVIDDSLVQEPM